MMTLDSGLLFGATLHGTREPDNVHHVEKFILITEKSERESKSTITDTAAVAGLYMYTL